MHRRSPTQSRVVPFLDLSRTNRSLQDIILAGLAEVFERGDFIDGADITAFEREFAAYCGSSFCVGTASGIDALRLALLAGGIEPGDEVIVPAATFVATLEAVTQAGGVPVVVDVSEADLNLDPGGIEDAVTSRTRFVLPVHLYGQLSDMREIGSLATRRALHVVEDAAQGHGAERDGLRAGGSGQAAAFSFYPGKNLGAAGDAGALTTDDESVAETARALRQHGQRYKYVHEREGYTARLDTLQAVVLLRKLPLLDSWNQQRRQVAAMYLEALDGVGDLRLPPIPPGSAPVFHLFVVRTGNPVALAEFLGRRGIQTGRHYPTPVHLTPAYAHLGYAGGAFPVAEALSRECLSIPIFPGIKESELAQVVEAIEEYFANG